MMYFSRSPIVAFSLLASSSLVAGHAAIIGATGDAGGQGSAIGVDPATPRDGTNRNPFQQDATRFRGDAADSCGETLGGGDNAVETGTAQVMSLNGGTLPQVSAGGQIMMTVHQVNADGAGPYTCMIDATGTGTNWVPITVTQNLEGSERGRNRDTQMQDLPLTAAIPAGQTCTGTVAGQANVCMVRCENPARAGPFGGCVPVQMAAAAAAVAPVAAAPIANTNVGATAPVNSAAPAAIANPSTALQAAEAVAPVANVNTGTSPQLAAPQQPAQPPITAPVANVNTGNVAQVPAAATTPISNTAIASGPTTVGTTPDTVPASAPIAGAAARKRAAARNEPALTNDEQEEELNLLNGEF